MGEAKVNGIIRQQSTPVMPSPAQIKAMEASACQLADALYAVGMGLDAPDKRQAAKMLAFIAVSKVLARFAADEKMTPDQAGEWAAAGMVAAVRLAMRQDIAAAGRAIVRAGGL